MADTRRRPRAGSWWPTTGSHPAAHFLLYPRPVASTCVSSTKRPWCLHPPSGLLAHPSVLFETTACGDTVTLALAPLTAAPIADLHEDHDSGRRIDTGVDTVSFQWREPDLGQFEEQKLASHRFISNAGEVLQLTHSQRCMLIEGEGIRFGINYAGGVWAEGRLAQMLGTTEALTPRDRLADGVRATSERLREMGIKVDVSDAGIRRLDLAADVYFSQPSKGVALMNVLAGIRLPRRKTVITRAHTLESVYFQTERTRKIRFAAYDKSVQSGTAAAAGLWIRLERRERYQGVSQPLALSPPNDFATLWLGDLVQWAATAASTTVASQDVLADHVIALYHAGKVELKDLDKALGAIHMSARGLDRNWPAHTQTRRRQFMRDLGIAITDCPIPYQFHFGALLSDIVTNWQAAPS